MTRSYLTATREDEGAGLKTSMQAELICFFFWIIHFRNAALVWDGIRTQTHRVRRTSRHRFICVSKRRCDHKNSKKRRAESTHGSPRVVWKLRRQRAANVKVPWLPALSNVGFEQRVPRPAPSGGHFDFGRCFAGSFVCLMPADHASRCSSHQPKMTGEKFRCATHDGSFSAALGFHRGNRSKRKKNSHTTDNELYFCDNELYFCPLGERYETRHEKPVIVSATSQQSKSPSSSTQVKNAPTMRGVFCRVFDLFNVGFGVGVRSRSGRRIAGSITRSTGSPLHGTLVLHFLSRSITRSPRASLNRALVLHLVARSFSETPAAFARAVPVNNAPTTINVVANFIRAPWLGWPPIVNATARSSFRGDAMRPGVDEAEFVRARRRGDRITVLFSAPAHGGFWGTFRTSSDVRSSVTMGWKADSARTRQNRRR